MCSLLFPDWIGTAEATAMFQNCHPSFSIRLSSKDVCFFNRTLSFFLQAERGSHAREERKEDVNV